MDYIVERFMDDIVERLRGTEHDKDNFLHMTTEKWLSVGLALEAANEIVRHRAENKRLRAALQRIVDFYDDTDDSEDIMDVPNVARAALGVDRSASLAEITRLRIENERLREALASTEAWIDRWSVDIGNCRGGKECTCGRTAMLYEARTALMKDSI